MDGSNNRNVQSHRSEGHKSKGRNVSYIITAAAVEDGTLVFGRSAPHFLAGRSSRCILPMDWKVTD